MYSDIFLEQMGEQFCALDLYHKHGIRFDVFLVHHKSIMAEFDRLPDLTRFIKQNAAA